MLRSLQSRTFTPPTVYSFGAFIQFPSEMQRCSVIRLTPSFFAASRDEQAFIGTDLEHTFPVTYHAILSDPATTDKKRRAKAHR